MKRGDIVLVAFPFTNLKGTKRRPALVLYQGNSDAVLAFITTQLSSEGPYDIYIGPNSKNGLKQASLIKTGKLATLDLDLISGKIGSVSKEKYQEVVQQLLFMFQQE